MLRRAFRLIWGDDVDPALRPLLLVGFAGSLTGASAWTFIGIWAVVVDDRVFVRSWSIKRRSWYRTFLSEPRGAIQIGNREIPVRARPATGARIRDAVDRAYLEKYHTKGWVKYAQDLGRPKSRATTTELRPRARERDE